MRGPIPPRPTGNSPEALFMQAVWDNLHQGNLQVRQAKGVRVSGTAHGQIIEPEKAGGSAGTGRAEKLIVSDFEAADYLICRPWNEDYWTARRELRITLAAVPTATQIAAEMGISLADLNAYLALEVLVAKPYSLRADVFDEKLIDISVESLTGVTLSAATRTLWFYYWSATFRTVYDVPTDFDALTEIAEEEYNFKENQVIIPRYSPEETTIDVLTSRNPLVVGANTIRKMDINTESRHWQRTAH